MGNIISNTTQQTAALDLAGGNLNVKNQFSASGPSIFNGTGTFNKPVIHNDISTFNATGVFNKPVSFNDAVTIPSNKINNIDLTTLSSSTDVSSLRTTVSGLVGTTGAIDTGSVKTSKLDINGDIVNTGTGPAYITANTGAGLVLKDGNATGANIKIYNGAVSFNGPMTGTSLTLSGELKAGAMTGTSLELTGALKAGAMTGSSLNVTGIVTTGGTLFVGHTLPEGRISVGNQGLKISTMGGFLSTIPAPLTAGTITGSSLSAGTGTISGGVITGTSLVATGSGPITGGVITGTSLTTGTGTITGGAITGTSLSATGSGTISGGAITGTSITGTGALTAPSLNLTSSSGGNWSIKEEGTKGLCFFKGATGFACISSDGNLIAY